MNYIGSKFKLSSWIEEEVKKVLQLVDRIYSVFGLPYEIELSTRPESGYIGSEEIWMDQDIASNVIEQIAREMEHYYEK